jgi:hypothetical protein
MVYKGIMGRRQVRVFVYYNLHRHTWSIKALEGAQKGLVVAHSDTVLLQDAVGKVSQAGRNRVLRESRKNVHAGIVGELVHTGKEGYFPGQEVTYNPYKYESFVHKDTEEVYTGSQFAYMDNRRVYTV